MLLRLRANRENTWSPSIVVVHAIILPSSQITSKVTANKFSGKHFPKQVNGQDNRINKLYIKSKCIEVYEGFRASV